MEKGDSGNSNDKKIEHVMSDTGQKGKPEQTAGKNANGTTATSKEKKKPLSFETWLRIIEVVFIAVASLCVSIVSCWTAYMEYQLNLANSRLHVEVYCDNNDIDKDGMTAWQAGSTS